MATYSYAQRLTADVPLIGAAALGTFAALVAALMPSSMLESLVMASGIASLVPSAEPPLGFTARMLLGLLAGGGMALIGWFGLSYLFEYQGSRGAGEQGVPSVRRADAHPDAPPREPLRAVRDLGFDMPEPPQPEPVEIDLNLPELPPEPVIAMGMALPDEVHGEEAPEAPEAAEPVTIVASVAPPRPAPLEVPATQPLPCDLDQPLAAFDPGALREVPLAPPRPLAPLTPARAQPEIEQEPESAPFEAAEPAAEPAPAPETPREEITLSASVDTLLDRLERGIARRTREKKVVTMPAPAVPPVPPVEPLPAVPAPDEPTAPTVAPVPPLAPVPPIAALAPVPVIAPVPMPETVEEIAPPEAIAPATEAEPPQPQGLESTLEMLRRMAVRG